MSKALLIAKNLSHKFDYLLYKNVSLSINTSQSIAVMGRSGSGKSTLLHTLAGLIEPLEGSVEMLGYDLYNISESQKELLRREKTGVVFQQHYLFKGMSGRGNVEIASMLAKQNIDESIFKFLQIEKVIDQKVSKLSGGQQQRVSLARVLSKRPKLIFADEPTGNLDVESSKLVMEVLLDYVAKNRAGLLIVTHDIDIAKRCDRVYYLKEHRLIKGD